MMISLLMILILFLIGYSILLVSYKKALDAFKRSTDKVISGHSELSYSIVIAARNEAAYITACIHSIVSQAHISDWELIVVDDHSTDNTYDLVKSIPQTAVQIVRLPEGCQGKKAAIAYGVALAKHPIIIATDADCIVTKGWLSNILYTVQQQQQPVAAPVLLHKGTTVLSQFQFLDFAMLQAITASGYYNHWHRLCNGANLAYAKNDFNAVTGFSTVDHIASGDDIFLWQKFETLLQRKPVYCLQKNALVLTASCDSWKSFLHQRIRWGGKNKLIRNNRLKAILLFVYLWNILLLFMLLLTLFNPIIGIVLLVCLWVKNELEWGLMNSFLAVFDEQVSRLKLFSFQLLHVGYTCLAGSLSLFNHFEWKGRSLR